MDDRKWRKKLKEKLEWYLGWLRIGEGKGYERETEGLWMGKVGRGKMDRLTGRGMVG